MSRIVLIALLICNFAMAIQAKEAAVRKTEVRRTHEQLQAALWVRTSVEYDVACVQAYALAAMRVEEALADPSWSAAIEQTVDYHELPPAVVLDVDETVLDNSTFQVRLVSQNIDFSAKLWDQWVAEEQAVAVPGAKDFIKFLVAKKIAVLFVTNRDVSGEAATVNNLSAVLDMPVTKEQVLCKSEQADWTSDKTARRAHLAKSHRLLLLVGDDFNDFVLLGKVSPQHRVEKGKEYQQHWGKKWIQLPNPLYGHWEKSIFKYDYSMSDEQKLNIKYETLGNGSTAN
ncbi:MAG: HAD family acid phosphatase [Planctomycetota bacterium]